ncbi:hypothetical protein, partial [Ralstonia solanacearum]|uniref:hypothetical protein n=1 Tax=Ralstonia solanacearum TaxID=305 RepID=UPI001E584F84
IEMCIRRWLDGGQHVDGVDDFRDVHALFSGPGSAEIAGKSDILRGVIILWQLKCALLSIVKNKEI